MFHSKPNCIKIDEDLYNEFVSRFQGNVKDFIENSMREYIAKLSNKQKQDINKKLEELIGKKDSVPYKIVSAYFIARRKLGQDNIRKEDLLEICVNDLEILLNTFNTNFSWMKNGTAQCKYQIFDGRKKVYLYNDVKKFLEDNEYYFLPTKEEN